MYDSAVIIIIIIASCFHHPISIRAIGLTAIDAIALSSVISPRN